MSTTLSTPADIVPPPVMALTGNTWDRMPDEPTVWYERFDRYYRPLHQGNRSLLGAYRLYLAEMGRNIHPTAAAQNWRDKASLYNWHDRAMSYDDHQRAIARVDEEQAKLESRQYRITVLTDLLKYAHAAMPEIDWKKSTGSQLSHAIKTATAELRIDHHDVPATQHNVDVRAILAVLPVELRAVVAQTLKKSGD